MGICKTGFMAYQLGKKLRASCPPLCPISCYGPVKLDKQPRVYIRKGLLQHSHYSVLNLVQGLAVVQHLIDLLRKFT